MTLKFSPRLEKWQDQTKNLVEQDGIRLVCLYLDQKSGKVNLLTDSESEKCLGQSRSAFKELENILEREVEEKEKLFLYNHNQVREGEEDPCSKACHSCHHLVPMFQLEWEKNLGTSCFMDKNRFTHVKDYDKLPAEILRIIFGFLKPEDLKNVLLVSKKWKSVADEPVLWAGFDLPQKCRENSENFYRFLDFSLSSKLQHLTLTGSKTPPDDENGAVNDDYFKFEIKDEHIQHLLNLELVSIEIKSIDLSKVSDDLLAKLVNSCKKCDITEYYEDYPTPPNNNFLDLSSDDDDIKKLCLGVKKMTAIFRESQESKLKSLRLRHLRKNDWRERKKLDLSSIPSAILAKAFSKLEILDLENLQFTSEQLSTVFDLDLGRCLRRLRLHGVEMDFIQARHLMKALDASSQLKKLDLSEVDVSRIPSMFLAGVINKIEWVVLKDLEIEGDQVEEIFLSIIRGDSAMKHLGMFGMNTSLSDVDEEVFAKAVNILESVAFDEELPEDLIVEMFNVMSIETNLKIIGMPSKEIPVDAFENVRYVDEQILAKALNNLWSVRIDLGNYDRDCFFNMPQLITFFKQLSSRSQLKRIVREDWPDWSQFPY